MYINADPDAGGIGIGGPTGQKIETRASIIALWNTTRVALEQAGAEVVIVDFPVVSNYEGDRKDAPNIATRGILPFGYLHYEISDLSVWAWDDFLKNNDDPMLFCLANVDGSKISSAPKDSLPDRYTGFEDDIADYPAHARTHVTAFGIPHPSPRACAALRKRAALILSIGWTQIDWMLWSSPPLLMSALQMQILTQPRRTSICLLG
jgi:Asp-tRNA(Asn)/Glu-tRNA(Gln) amidotransferase A subunit family amidase